VLAVLIELASDLVLLELVLDLDVFKGQVVETLEFKQKLVLFKLDLVFGSWTVMGQLNVQGEEVVVPGSKMVLMLTELVSEVKCLLDASLVEGAQIV